MKLVYTEQALVSLEEALEFIASDVSYKKLIKIRDKILDAADTLISQPFLFKVMQTTNKIQLKNISNYYFLLMDMHSFVTA